MPTPEVHVSAVSGLFTFLSGAIAIIFDVPAPVVFAGFLGTIAGQAIAPSVRYYQGIFIVLMGTTAAAFATPMLIIKFGEYPARGVAFFTAVLLVGFRIQLIRLAKKIIKSKGGN